MRAYEELSRRGQLARLRLLAADTLRDGFGVEPRAISLLAAHSFNMMFRAELSDGQRVAVRVGDVRIHADGVEEVEAAWLEAVRADTELLVPTLLADRHVDHVVAGSHPLVPGIRWCSVMTWVAGHTVRQEFDHPTAKDMGVVLASLHEQAAAYRPPEVPAGIVADRVLRFADTSLLADYQSPHGTLFVEAIDRVQRHLDSLWRSPRHPPHLLHGDFGPQNVMRWRQRLTPIDFQDLLFGFDVQDVAITVSDLRRSYPDETLVDSFADGYRSIRPWPLDDEDLDAALSAARRLNFINLGLNLQRPGLDEYIERHAAAVAQWMGLATTSTLI